MSRFRHYLAVIKRSIVFTPVGGVVFLVVLVILLRSLINRNSYEILLSCGILLLLLLLGIIGFWKSFKLKAMEPGWKPPFPMTANTNERTDITGLAAPVPLFFRLHYFVRGRFFPGGDSDKNSDGSSMLIETSVSRGATAAQLMLDFPMSGVFKGDGYCKLRDIFGFFSFSCGQPLSRTVNVRSAPCFGKRIHINAQSGAEDKRHKQSADEERFYMREYTPGDRLRDINWKSSDRIDTLITRISTDTQEKISRIEVHFRNYKSQLVKGKHQASLEELWLLDRAKARLAYFLRSIKDQNSSFIFDVRAAQGNWEIEDDQDLDAFLEELSGLSFATAKNENIPPAGAGDIYVFSTACDKSLPDFLLACNTRPVTLFISQPGLKTAEIKKNKSMLPFSEKDKKLNNDNEKEILHIGDFESKGCTVPARWFAFGKVKPLSVNNSRMEINYADVKL